MSWNEGFRRAGVLLCLVACILFGHSSAKAASLRWVENGGNIAYYTVYAEFSSGVFRHVVRGTAFNLDLLPPNTEYSLFVTATSTEGLESRRSVGIPYSYFSTRPWIASHPISTNITSGGDLSLSVKTSSATSTTYQWKKNGVVIGGATGPQLRIPGVSNGHSGRYTVVVSNSSGTVESVAADVIVQTLPRIYVQPQSTRAAVGNLLLLSVAAEGTGIRYQWLRNGEPIAGGTNATLSISNIQKAHEGSYQVTVQNLVGEVQSTFATVSVWPPISISQQPVSSRVVQGSQLRLSVVASGPEPMTFQWYRNGMRLDGQTSSELTVDQAKQTDAGLYTVRINSFAQTVLSAAAQVTVQNSEDISLSMRQTMPGQLLIIATGPPNTTFEMQATTEVASSNWSTVQTVSTDSTGKFETYLFIDQTDDVFVRAKR